MTVVRVIRARGALVRAGGELRRVLSAFEAYRRFYAEVGQRPFLSGDPDPLTASVHHLATLLYAELGDEDYSKTRLPRPDEFDLSVTATVQAPDAPAAG